MEIQAKMAAIELFTMLMPQANNRPAASKMKRLLNSIS